ncbi:MAG: GDSL-type esterase/lipase family protein [Kiritimatiellae bacterium]|nr:GDSL-type esterase/lipase family protein [Kiritimatiellia bacterium]
MRGAAACGAFVAFAAAVSSAGSPPLRIACVGDSITFGAGLASASLQSYPARLAELFPTGRVIVGNFGAPGRTLLRGGDLPYVRDGAFRAAIEFAPDAVVILLGANDTRPPNRGRLGEFKRDAADLVQRFQRLASRPVVVVALPTPAWENPHGVDGELLREEVVLRWCEVAAECRAHVVDLHTPLRSARSRFPDGVHPDEHGSLAVAMLVYGALRSRLLSSGLPESDRDALGGMDSRWGELWPWGDYGMPNVAAALKGNDWLRLHRERVAGAAERGVRLLLVGDAWFEPRHEPAPEWAGTPAAWMGVAGDEPEHVMWRLLDGLSRMPALQYAVVRLSWYRLTSERRELELADAIRALRRCGRPGLEIAVLLGPFETEADRWRAETVWARLEEEAQHRRTGADVVWLDRAVPARREGAAGTASAMDRMELVRRWLESRIGRPVE